MSIFKPHTMLKYFSVLVCMCWVSGAAYADERITNFKTQIEVQTSGDIIITEIISLIKEGDQINRGILRDLPRYYENDGQNYPYQYSNISVFRDGQKETYKHTNDGNAYRLQIGEADVILENGPHTYSIRYAVKNQVRYFGGYDEIYWNATGTYWTFPIDAASVEIVLPSGGILHQQNAYTGAQGSDAQDYRFSQNGDSFHFTTTTSLGIGEGLTIALGFKKGLIDPPSAADARALWWMKNGAISVLLAALVGIFGFFMSAWNKVGRDPQKGPVFARYEPPKNYSPAAAHRVYHNVTLGHSALISTLLSLAIKGRIDIDASEKETVLSKIPTPSHVPALMVEETNLYAALFAKDSSSLILKGKPNSRFSKAYEKFSSKLDKQYGSDYHKYNVKYIFIGFVLSVIAAIAAISQLSGDMTLIFGMGLSALAVLNVVFMFLIPAPTHKGQAIKTEIEGFKLYMETAEKLQLNTAKPGTDTLPLMTKERYERFLPYAVALDVEKPWTKYFENVIPIIAQNYNPRYGRMRSGNTASLAHLNKALIDNVSSGVSSAMPQSSSSSGSSGGGFSGGGGGGGGGSGW